MSNKINIELNDIYSQINNESKINFNYEVNLDGLGDDEFIFEYQLSLFKSDGKDTSKNWHHIYFGNLENTLISKDNKRLFLSESLNMNGIHIPNTFKFHYRFLKEVDKLNFESTLPKEENSCIINSSKNILTDGKKLEARDVEINSLVFKNTGDGHIDYRYTTTCNKPNERGILLEFKEGDEKIKTDPIILKHKFITNVSNIEASKNIMVNCRIFEALNWNEIVCNNSFNTEKFEYEE
jgi:hypothetical protein